MTEVIKDWVGRNINLQTILLTIIIAMLGYYIVKQDNYDKLQDERLERLDLWQNIISEIQKRDPDTTPEDKLILYQRSNPLRGKSYN